MENTYTNNLIKECTGDIITSICYLGNVNVTLSILNNYYIDKEYDNLYNGINIIVLFSLAYPYYIFLQNI